MFHTAICICTYRNPVGLQMLLDGLDAQNLGGMAVAGICIVVVDNDDRNSAEGVLARYNARGRFDLVWVKQPSRGLSTARNTALSTSEVQASTFFAFLDDDEVPGKIWLRSLVEAMRDMACSIVVGPVKPHFPQLPPAWVLRGAFFHKPCLKAHEIHQGYTSNVLLRTAVVRDTGVRFDESLNQIGGEDVMFFRQLRARNCEVRCVPDAVVYETISLSRATLSWMTRRWIRSGATSALLDRDRPMDVGARAGVALQGAARVIGGLVKTAAIAVSRGGRDFDQIARSLSTACRGVGMLMAAFGQIYKEYGSSYRRDQE